MAASFDGQLDELHPQKECDYGDGCHPEDERCCCSHGLGDYVVNSEATLEEAVGSRVGGDELPRVVAGCDS